MAATYTAMQDLVRNWANRDEQVLSNAIIKDCLKYAADKAYRTLRIVPLEAVASYSKTVLTAATTGATGVHPSLTKLELPGDLIEVIQVKELDAAGVSTRVWNEKVDIRTFNDPIAEKYTANNYFSREQNTLLLSPGFGDNTLGDPANSIELHYYKRLPAIDATYAVTPLNYTAGYLTTTNGTTPLHFVNGNTTTAYATQAEAVAADTGTNVTANVNGATTNTTALVVDGNVGTIVQGMAVTGAGITSVVTVATVTNQNTLVLSSAQTLANDTPITFSNTNFVNYIGIDSPHWLRDENERALLYGALVEVFAYLQDDEQAAKYKLMFDGEIAALNDEDAKRNSSGGNIQINFNGRGLI